MTHIKPNIHHLSHFRAKIAKMTQNTDFHILANISSKSTILGPFRLDLVKIRPTNYQAIMHDFQAIIAQMKLI